jgi:hypothetical protein
MSALLSKAALAASAHSSLTATPPRYDPDLDLIRDPRDPSRFCCVYPMGRERYRARVLKRLNIGTADSQVEAAKLVLNFYRRVFGDQWKHAFRRRKVNPWRVKRMRKKGGETHFVADVFVDGNPIRVTLADTKRFTGVALPMEQRLAWSRENQKKRWRRELDAYKWWSRAEAIQAVRQFIHHQLGVYAMLRMWRR